MARKADLQQQARDLGLDDTGTSAELEARIRASGNEPTSGDGGGDGDTRSKSLDGEAPAVGTAEGLPQGQTMPRRSMTSDDEVVIRDDVPLSKDIRLTPDAGEDVGESQVQAQVDQENEVGFRGAASDPTPNSHYSVEGVTQGLPTPETHMGQRRAARDAHTLDEGVEPY